MEARTEDVLKSRRPMGLTMINYMDMAFEEAQKAADRGEVPVGAVVVASDGTVLARQGNRTEEDLDPTAHAEILAVREAAQKMGSPRLVGADLYVTLEPCAMCAAALSFARLRRVIFAAYDPKGGGVDHGGRFYQQPTCHHVPEVIGGVDEQRAAVMLRSFFQGKR